MAQDDNPDESSELRSDIAGSDSDQPAGDSASDGLPSAPIGNRQPKKLLIAGTVAFAAASVFLTLVLTQSQLTNGMQIAIAAALYLVTAALFGCLLIMLKGWKHKTTVVSAFAAAAIALGLVLAYIQVRPENQGGSSNLPPAQDAPASPGEAMCSDSSEGSVPSGWGPDRATFSDSTHPPALTFNSTSTNPNVGDERNFVGVRGEGDTERLWQDAVEAKRGQTYVIRAYVRLDGPPELEASDVGLSVNVPTCTGHRIAVSGIISDGSFSAYPAEVWDGLSFWSRDDFNLRYIPDSALLYNNAHPQGAPLPESLFTNRGAMLGYTKLDGTFRPGYEYAAYVSFKVMPQFG